MLIRNIGSTVAMKRNFCWKLTDLNGSILYARQIPASLINKFSDRYHYNYSKIDCNSFCNWTIIEKSKSKVTGFYIPAREYRETFCNKLFVGRIIVYRETADSITTREFTKAEP